MAARARARAWWPGSASCQPQQQPRPPGAGASTWPRPHPPGKPRMAERPEGAPGKRWEGAGKPRRRETKERTRLSWPRPTSRNAPKEAEDPKVCRGKKKKKESSSVLAARPNESGKPRSVRPKLALTAEGPEGAPEKAEVPLARVPGHVGRPSGGGVGGDASSIPPAAAAVQNPPGGVRRSVPAGSSFPPAMVEKEEPGQGERGGSHAAISEEEAAQYDRQIRLWGLEAQKRLRASRVLLVGMKGLGAEVAKNLILAGVKALTMLDHHQVLPEDSQAQFLIPAGSLGKNRVEASLERARDLNPMVDVKVDTEDIAQKPEEYFTHFDVVCLTVCSQEILLKVEQICHKNKIKFFAGDVFGYHGYMFANLGDHEFVEEKTKAAKASQSMEDGPEAKKPKMDFTETTLVKKRVAFCLLKEALSLSWSSEKAKAALKRTTPDYFLLQVLLRFRTEKGRDPSLQSDAEDTDRLLQLRTEVLASLGVDVDLLPEDFPSSCFSEMAPVCAVVGGVLSQEVVKALSQRDPPLNNFFFFDGMKGGGIVECLAPMAESGP